MKINVSGPNGLNYMTLIDMAQAILNDPKTMISDMRFGAANGVGYKIRINEDDEPAFKYYLYITKGQINIDIQEIFEAKKEEDDGERTV